MFLHELQRKQLAFDNEFEKLLAFTSLLNAPDGLRQAIQYSLFASSAKRIRPILSLESAHRLTIDNEQSMYVAAALELVHTYSLIHDDLPAMDDDDLRRGKPTNHKVYGEDVAILAGDALQSLAFECLALAKMPSEGITYFAECAGAGGMVGGQYLDMKSSGKVGSFLLQQIHRKKTGRLLEAAFALPFFYSGKGIAHARRFGMALGKLFQIADDLLDATATTGALGKNSGKDGDKLTYVRLYGINRTRRILKQTAQRLQRFAIQHYGDSPIIVGLPDYVANRPS